MAGEDGPYQGKETTTQEERPVLGPQRNKERTESKEETPENLSQGKINKRQKYITGSHL